MISQLWLLTDQVTLLMTQYSTRVTDNITDALFRWKTYRWCLTHIKSNDLGSPNLTSQSHTKLLLRLLYTYIFAQISLTTYYCTLSSSSLQVFSLYGSKFTYKDLKAIVPLDWKFRHVVTHGQINFSIHISSLRNTKDVSDYHTYEIC